MGVKLKRKVLFQIQDTHQCSIIATEIFSLNTGLNVPRVKKRKFDESSKPFTEKYFISVVVYLIPS
jgi:hypothetical protein